MTSNIQKVYTDSASDKNQRNQLVNLLYSKEGISDTSVLKAMAEVPRHWFVPSESVSAAYENIPLSIGHGQTISQPFIVAKAAELLELKGNERVLEIGGGSGYQAAILSRIAWEVFAVEQSPELCERAQEVVDKLESDNLNLLCGDGKKGWPQYAPYDRILVSCAVETPPTAWFDQLKVGGRLVFPHQTGDGQWMERWTRGETEWTGIEKILPVKFVPLL